MHNDLNLILRELPLSTNCEDVNYLVKWEYQNSQSGGKFPGNLFLISSF